MTSSAATKDLEYFSALDTKLVAAAGSIKVLSVLGWPARHYQEFMATWQRGQPELPKVEYPRFDLSESCTALQEIIDASDNQHPVGRFITQTAASYIIAARMLENVGKAKFCEFSEVLYGSPTDRVGTFSNLALAENFIKITGDFSLGMPPAEDMLTPEAVAAELGQVAATFFQPYKIDVVIDQNLAAKAAAGSERVRIRGMTTFSRAEIDQLREHELFVHSATRLNGSEQPHLKSLGLGSPRTTGTQEGLATFAELVTATMDLGRLRRIALRIKAISMARDGGDFIEIFRFFLAMGQSEKESFQSTARIFRGGDVRGRFVFTKDVVYLKGLLSVHTFLRKAIEQRKIDYPRYLFIGRLTLGDILALEDFIKQGFITLPRFLPKWAANREGLAAYLSYSVFTHHLNVADINLADFGDKCLIENIKGTDLAAIA
jgi:uncharacterized protein (TIGR02421 family)